MVYDGEGFQSLHLAAQFGHTAVCAYLLAHGVPVNSPDMQGMTPLMWAAFRTATYSINNMASIYNLSLTCFCLQCGSFSSTRLTRCKCNFSG
jgi:palmitoyltransferase ZDHHC13/17